MRRGLRWSGWALASAATGGAIFVAISDDDPVIKNRSGMERRLGIAPGSQSSEQCQTFEVSDLVQGQLVSDGPLGVIRACMQTVVGRPNKPSDPFLGSMTRVFGSATAEVVEQPADEDLTVAVKIKEATVSEDDHWKRTEPEGDAVETEHNAVTKGLICFGGEEVLAWTVVTVTVVGEVGISATSTAQVQSGVEANSETGLCN